MSLRTKLTEKLGLSHPILLAPMGTASGGALAKAVTEAGGLGLDHWALAGSTSAARVLHCRLWGLQLRTFASMDISFITPQIVLVVLVTLVLLVAALVLVTLGLRSG